MCLETPKCRKRATQAKTTMLVERSFTPDKVTLNKREVREQLYDDVRALFPRAKTFGMLAGGAPKEEIDCIRTRFYRAKIVAFDINPVAVEAAKACGVEAVLGNVNFAKTFARGCETERKASQVDEDNHGCEASQNTRNKRAMHPETTAGLKRATPGETTKVGERFDFFDLDLCKTLTTHKRAIQNTARFTASAMSVFASYSDRAGDEGARAKEAAREYRASSNKTSTGRERAVGGETTKAPERATDAETTGENERATIEKTPMWAERAVEGETTRLHELPDAQLGRVLLLHSIVLAARPEAQIARAYVYRGSGSRGGGQMMIGALFVFSKRPIEMLPPFCTAKEEATHEREHRLRSLGVSGKKLRSRLKNGNKEAKRASQRPRDIHDPRTSHSR